jgi:hypothetical protein
MDPAMTAADRAIRARLEHAITDCKELIVQLGAFPFTEPGGALACAHIADPHLTRAVGELRRAQIFANGALDMQQYQDDLAGRAGRVNGERHDAEVTEG